MNAQNIIMNFSLLPFLTRSTYIHTFASLAAFDTFDVFDNFETRDILDTLETADISLAVVDPGRLFLIYVS